VTPGGGALVGHSPRSRHTNDPELAAAVTVTYLRASHQGLTDAAGQEWVDSGDWPLWRGFMEVSIQIPDHLASRVIATGDLSTT
jgi:hypothetical protein